MPNIPSIHNRPATNSRLVNRARKVMPGEHTTDESHRARRRIERRHRQERRQKRLNVKFERRQAASRRKSIETGIKLSTDKASLSDTVGKNINTTA